METVMQPVDVRLPRTSWLSRFFLGSGVFGLVCMIYWVYAHSLNEARAMFAYLFSYISVLSIALGCLIFVLIQHATRAGWSAVIRRIPETAMATMPLFLLLFIPIACSTDVIFSWTQAGAHDEVLAAKAPYLNLSFFLVRSAIYLCLWVLLGVGYYRWSIKQDGGKNQDITRRMWWFSGLGIISFALSSSFASFDWLMSLQPHWFSTIFGIYFFAGCMLAALAFITLMCIALQSCGVLSSAITKEHYHDLGKLLFGFTVFWAYIAFSQFMLIWYANIPEETEFYIHRLHHGWECITWILPLTNFFFPFFVLMSRHVKRKKVMLVLMCLWILATHFMDIYWLVLPAYKDALSGIAELHFLPIDALCLLGMLGLFLGVFGWLLSREDVLPSGDTRLKESISFENF